MEWNHEDIGNGGRGTGDQLFVKAHIWYTLNCDEDKLYFHIIHVRSDSQARSRSIMMEESFRRMKTFLRWCTILGVHQFYGCLGFQIYESLHLVTRVTHMVLIAMKTWPKQYIFSLPFFFQAGGITALLSINVHHFL